MQRDASGVPPVSHRRSRIARLMEPEHQADRLRRLRIVAGKRRKANGKPLSTTDMARLLGIGQQQYSAYETRGDKPSNKALAAMRDELDVTADWVLLGDDDNMPYGLLQELNAVTPDELRSITKQRS